MKKFFKRLCCVSMVLMMLFGTLVCKKGETPEAEEESALGAGTYVINDFSTYLDLYQLLPQDKFGVIDLNTDKDYYLTGSGSAKIAPNMSSTNELTVKQRLISETKNLHFGDLSHATKITAQIYNASDPLMLSEIEDWNLIIIKNYPGSKVEILAKS